MQPKQSYRNMRNTQSYSDMFLVMNQFSDDKNSQRSKSIKHKKHSENAYQLDNINQNLFLIKNNEKVIK